MRYELSSREKAALRANILKKQKAWLENKDKSDRHIRAVLGRLQALMNCDDEEMGRLLGVTRRTYQNRRRDPSSFTIDEFRKICELGIKEEELKAIFTHK